MLKYEQSYDSYRLQSHDVRFVSKPSCDFPCQMTYGMVSLMIWPMYCSLRIFISATLQRFCKTSLVSKYSVNASILLDRHILRDSIFFITVFVRVTLLFLTWEWYDYYVTPLHLWAFELWYICLYYITTLLQKKCFIFLKLFGAFLILVFSSMFLGICVSILVLFSYFFLQFDEWWGLMFL